jgi:hypothetical protein
MYDCRGSDLSKMIHIFRDVKDNLGLRGLYSGLKPDLMRILPSNTIVFLVYEFMKKNMRITLEQ